MKLINLIKNEFIKLFHYRSVVFLLVVLVLVGPFVFYTISSSEGGIKEEFGDRLAEMKSVADNTSFSSDNSRYLSAKASYESLDDVREFDTNSKKALIELEGYDILYYHYFFDAIDNKEEADYYLNKYNELKNDINNLSTNEVLDKYKAFHENELEKLKNYYNNVTLTSEKEFFAESIENKNALIDSYKYKKTYSKDFESDDYDYYATTILEYILFSDYANVTKKVLDDNFESFDEKEGTYDTIQTYYQDKYYLDNHDTSTETTSTEKFSSGINSFLSICVLVTLLFAIADIVPSEFKAKTAKQLLIRPYSRYKVLASKYIVSLIYGIAILAISMILFVFTSALLSNFNAFDNMVIYDINTSKLVILNFLQYFLLIFITKIPFVVLLVTLLMFFEVLTRNAGISGFVVFLLLIVGYAAGGNFYPNTFNPLFVSDLTLVMFGRVGTTLYSSMTNSIVTSIIEMLVFGIGSFIIFKNLDVKND